MAYRNNQSYIRFPETIKSIPEKNIDQTSAAIMEKIISNDQASPHLHDQPRSTHSQNVYDAIGDK